jgi:hypothetical protein
MHSPLPPPLPAHAAVIDESTGGLVFELKKAGELGPGPAFTARLEVDYKAPIPASADVVCSARVESVEGRKVSDTPGAVEWWGRGSPALDGCCGYWVLCVGLRGRRLCAGPADSVSVWLACSAGRWQRSGIGLVARCMLSAVHCTLRPEAPWRRRLSSELRTRGPVHAHAASGSVTPPSST